MNNSSFNDTFRVIFGRLLLLLLFFSHVMKLREEEEGWRSGVK